MYRIAICEDEAVFRLEQETVCRRICDGLHMEYEIAVFETGTDLLAVYDGGARYDLLLLDIVMDGLSGMELARRLRGLGDEAAIVFITSNPDYAIEGYDVGALHYLMKPLDGSALGKVIAADYKRRFSRSYLFVKSGTQNLRLPLKDIICLETVGRRVRITTLNGEIETPAKLAELLEYLPKEQFCRCHVGFAVNLCNIQTVSRTDAVAVNGKVVPVSRAYLKEVEKAFLKRIWEE